MEIKILEPKDAAIYKGLRLEGLRNHPEAFGSSYEEEKDMTLGKIESRLGDNHSFTFGAFKDEILVGVVTLILESRLKLKHRANIAAMYVSQRIRREGVGKRLMEAAIDKAKGQDGIEQIYLAVNASNEPAKKLYHSCGFVTYGCDKNALKINNQHFDEDLMVLFLMR